MPVNARSLEEAQKGELEMTKDWMFEYTDPYYLPLFVRIESSSSSSQSAAEEGGGRDKNSDKSSSQRRLVFQYSSYQSTLEHHHYDNFRSRIKEFGFKLLVLLSIKAGGDREMKSVSTEYPEPVCWVKAKE
ncbi:hypothetical protein BG004_004646 [Podila humilis]|nr:hypothetical protein BG004_004646 [Podila humilis]